MSSGAGGAAARVAFGSLAETQRARRAEIDAAIARVLDSGRFILGEEVARFEREFASFIGVPHAIGCANGTDAIALALRAAGAKTGDAAILPANACVPVIAAVRQAGLSPRLADVDPETLTLDPASAERARTPETRFLVAVHLYGGAADLDALSDVARRGGMSLIEDCAQSHGAELHGRRTGSFGAAAAFSFYPTKNLGACGDGGAVVTADPEIATRARELRQYGWTRRDFSAREGWNSRLDELQAAILSAKLPRLEAENARRREIAERYDAALEGAPVRRLRVREDSVSARHLYPIRCHRRDALREHLAGRGVETFVHYPVPPHLQPAYAFLGYEAGDFPASEEACATVLSLPLHAGLSDDDADFVAASVREFFDGSQA
ncbi:MAG TPA: DegT/DnrJ/EryC1/StrS family aminotransferase [Thermoanaerobaculia bacterium]|nr:DegT/DnrJ/EryC1/StrS family aminotransferase [Thermoanaerobaculia bacterium]